MKASEALQKMLRGMQADRAGYVRLHALLEAQFEAALRHQAEVLVGLADEIGALVDQLNGRRQQRVELLALLLGRDSGGGFDSLLRRLPEATAQTFSGVSQGLEQQVRECKRLNLRNCQLITDQHTLMQRVLGVEETVYAER